MGNAFVVLFLSRVIKTKEGIWFSWLLSHCYCLSSRFRGRWANARQAFPSGKGNFKWCYFLGHLDENKARGNHSHLEIWCSFNTNGTNLGLWNELERKLGQAWISHLPWVQLKLGRGVQKCDLAQCTFQYIWFFMPLNSSSFNRGFSTAIASLQFSFSLFSFHLEVRFFSHFQGLFLGKGRSFLMVGGTFKFKNQEL